MSLSPEQLQRVEDLVEGRYNDRDEFSAMLAGMSAAELHVFVSRFNWDVGIEPLMSVLAHPRCLYANHQHDHFHLHEVARDADAVGVGEGRLDFHLALRR